MSKAFRYDEILALSEDQKNELFDYVGILIRRENIELINSYNYAVIASVLFWLLVVWSIVGVVSYMDKKIPNEADADIETNAKT